MKQVSITIDELTGQTSNIEAKGFLGGECKKHTKAYADALGSDAKVEDKPEAKLAAPLSVAPTKNQFIR